MAEEKWKGSQQNLPLLGSGIDKCRPKKYATFKLFIFASKFQKQFHRAII